MSSYSYIEDGITEGNSHLSLNFRPRSRTMTNVDQSLSLDRELYSRYASSLRPHVIVPQRSTPHLRLHLSIPGGPPSASSSITPQSESPSTPLSLSSPIAGVVDLTKHVKTISADAVAQGGLSDIYKGEWCQSEMDSRCGGGEEVVVVAIKLLRILTRRDQDGVRARKRLNREVYVWHRLEHPNIVKLFGTSYHMSGRPAMVMRWYDNGNAAEYLAKKNPSADRKQLILDVARGLAYLHTHKPGPIIHADLKGNNVLITDDGRGVLCDFGLSQVVEDLGRPAGLTLSNPDVGPLRWQPPEFLEDVDEPATLTSDVWSYGCTAFELLTSLIPYSHRTRDAQVIRDMQNGMKPSGPTSTAFSLLPFGPRITDLLNKSWTFTPSERPTMTEIQTQLESICEHLVT